MAQVKATTTDVYARLAKGECANYSRGGCQGRTPCSVTNGEPCTYFNSYVKPLLDYPEYASKYGREARVSVALNPKAKVVRKRHQAAEPRLDLPAPPAAKQPVAPAAKQVLSRSTPATAAAARPTTQPKKTVVPALALTLEPVNPAKSAKSTKPARTTRQKDTPVTTVVTVDGDVRTRKGTARTPAPSSPIPPPAPAVAAKPAKGNGTPKPAITTVVTASGIVVEKPRVEKPEKAMATPVGKTPPAMPQLTLEIAPSAPPRKTAGRRR